MTSLKPIIKHGDIHGLFRLSVISYLKYQNPQSCALFGDIAELSLLRWQTIFKFNNIVHMCNKNLAVTNRI